MMFVAVMSFFVRISDPAVGGTYMTLLNTLANMGTTWPSTLSLYVVDSLTYRACSSTLLQGSNDCSHPSALKVCFFVILEHFKNLFDAYAHNFCS